jgi:hypothetical protein
VSVYTSVSPWFTGSGEADLLMERSACDGEVTLVLVVAVLFAAVGSDTAEPTVMELTITVPGAVPALTVKINVKLDVALAAIDGLVQDTVVAPTTQVQPAGTVSEEKVVFAGIVSTAVTLVAVAGPLLVTTAVYVILAPASTGFGESVMLTAISA